MDEEEKMRIIRTIIVPNNDKVLNGVHTLFVPQVVKDVEEVKSRYANIALEEVLRPFTI